MPAEGLLEVEVEPLDPPPKPVDLGSSLVGRVKSFQRPIEVGMTQLVGASPARADGRKPAVRALVHVLSDEEFEALLVRLEGPTRNQPIDFADLQDAAELLHEDFTRMRQRNWS